MERKFIISLFISLEECAHWGKSVEMEAIKICLTSNNYITDIFQSLTFLALWKNYGSKHVIFSSVINREKIASFFYRILEFHYFSQNRNSNTISLLFLQADFYHNMTSTFVSKMFTQQYKETFFLPHYQKSCQLLNYF